MKTFISAATALLALASFPANAATIPDGCYPAVQNWTNGSGYTCPIMGGSAVGSAAPPVVAPVFPTTSIEVKKEGCASLDLNRDILPAILRKETTSDALAATLLDPCSK